MGTKVDQIGRETFTAWKVIRSFLARAAALQSVAVRRSNGNDVVATISAVIFLFIYFPISRFSVRPFLIEGVLGPNKFI